MWHSLRSLSFSISLKHYNFHLVIQIFCLTSLILLCSNFREKNIESASIINNVKVVDHLLWNLILDQECYLHPPRLIYFFQITFPCCKICIFSYYSYFEFRSTVCLLIIRTVSPTKFYFFRSYYF